MRLYRRTFYYEKGWLDRLYIKNGTNPKKIKKAGLHVILKRIYLEKTKWYI